MMNEAIQIQEPQHPACFIPRVNAQPFFHGSLFSGIGGFDLAAEWAGWQNAFHCEWNEFGQKILKHYWPKAISYGDIKQTDFTIWRGRIDVLTGGFPCQPYSLAGKRKGKDDERHLWPEMLRAIREISPTYIVGENVYGLVNWNGGLVFHEVQTDLEAEGYEIQPVILPACAVNAPHKRERVWFVAYRTGELQQRNEAGKCGNKRQQTVQQEYWQADTKQPRTMGENGIFTHANDNGHNGPENRQSHFKGNDGNTARENTVEQFEGCGCEATRTIANATSQQGERLQPEQREFSQQEQRQFGGTSGEMGYRNATNTRCSERQNGIHGQKQGRQTTEFGNSYTQFGAWTQFPITEPTICGGNDGIPTELDGITFPKWRNESIKAYGNAIVPQIALQIFNAINLHAAYYGWR